MEESGLALALSRRVFGYARIAPDLRVIDRVGSLVDWLPPPGEIIFASPVFFAMEAEFSALREENSAPLDLPGLRLASFDDGPFSVSVLHDPASDGFLVFGSADSGAQDVEWRLARERRETQALEHRAQAARRLMREQAALYRDIVETSSDLVLRLDADLHVVFVNSNGRRLLRGQNESQILGRAVDAILGVAAPEESWGVRLAPRKGCSFQQALQPPEGEKIWIEWRVHWLGDRRGSGQYQAVGRDISDLVRLSAEAARGAEEARRNAVMRERLRIAHDLHDTLVHSLVALVPQMRLIRKVAGAGADPRLIDELDRAESAARMGLDRARAALANLRGRNIEPEGLGEALENLGRRFNERTGVQAVVDISQRGGGADGETTEALYRIAEEALRNVELHASASRVGLYLYVDESGTHTLVVADDGVGFDPGQVKPGHFGLIGMQEQATSIGARFAIEAGPGAGVLVHVIAASGSK